MSDGPADTGTPRGGTLSEVAGRIGRDALVYAVGMGSALPFAVLGLVIYTRYLEPSEYGTLAILLVSSSLVTVLYNVLTLPGTFSVVYGVTDGEDAADSGEAAPAVARGRKRQALSTGACLTVGVAAVTTAPLLSFAPEIATAMFGDPSEANEVRWAAASAAAGSVFRLTTNVFRMERRPSVWAGLIAMRPATSLAFGTWFVASGYGVGGILAGIAFGTVLTVLTALWLGRGLYARSAAPSLVATIIRRGGVTVPVVLGIWVIQNADILLLSVFASDGIVGKYRVANRLGAFMLYAISAFLMASGALERTALGRAAHSNHGRAPVRALLVRYYATGGVYLVLFLALAADALMLLAAPEYRDADSLIPVLAAGFLAFGMFSLLTRVAVVPRRARIHAALVTGGAVAFVASSVPLILWLGALGAALAMPTTMAMVCAAWILLIRRSSEPVPIPWRPITNAAAVATGCYLLTTLTDSRLWRPVADVFVALVLCPGLFLALRIVPRQHIRPLVSAVRTALRPRAQDRDAVRAQWEAMSPWDRHQLALASSRYRGRHSPRVVLDAPQTSRLLRQLGRLPQDAEQDEAIGAYLLVNRTEAERQARLDELWNEGVDPLALHQLEDLLKRVERLRAG